MSPDILNFHNHVLLENEDSQKFEQIQIDMSIVVDLLGTFWLIVGVSQLGIPDSQVPSFGIPLSLNYTRSHRVPLDYATLEAYYKGSQPKCCDTFLSSKLPACKMTPPKIGLAIFSSWSPLRSIAPN